MGCSPLRLGRSSVPDAGDPRPDLGRRLVVVSPHLDDAVLSVWTALRGHGDATVLTCFAGEPPVGAAVSAWDRQGGATSAGERVRVRRAEDRAVLRTLGVTAVHLDHLDAPYRDPDDGLVLERLTDTLRPHLREADAVLAPLGLGGHPDHVTAGRAALAAAPAGTVQLYADLPYASRWGWPRWVQRGRSQPRVQLRPVRGRAGSKEPGLVWRRALADVRVGDTVVRRLDDGELAGKREALAGYTTEAPSLGLDRRVGGEDVLRYEVRWAVRR